MVLGFKNLGLFATQFIKEGKLNSVRHCMMKPALHYKRQTLIYIFSEIWLVVTNGILKFRPKIECIKRYCLKYCCVRTGC